MPHESKNASKSCSAYFGRCVVASNYASVLGSNNLKLRHSAREKIQQMYENLASNS